MLSVRFEDKLMFRIDVPVEIQSGFSVPGFILQPIVENVKKHNNCRKSNPLQIIITTNKAETLLIKNNYQPKDHNHESLGIGWFNIKSRSKYLNASASVKYIRDEWFCVEVHLLKGKT